jgi:hypothetical protein
MTVAVSPAWLYEELAATWDLNRMRARFRGYGIRTGYHATRHRPTTAMGSGSARCSPITEWTAAWVAYSTAGQCVG